MSDTRVFRPPSGDYSGFLITLKRGYGDTVTLSARRTSGQNPQEVELDIVSAHRIGSALIELAREALDNPT